tara:strand:+ start:1695 stop:2483 length:789 start_codon:yes stop_codon:yes gene_type:complete
MMHKKSSLQWIKHHMPEVYTLTELASPTSPIYSTMSISYSHPGSESASSFSLPPFLFYAYKAKRLASLGFDDEAKVEESSFFLVRDAILKELRDIAKSVHRDVAKANLSDDMKSYISAAIQSRILYSVLSEKEPMDISLCNTSSVPINSVKAKKNITVPFYIFRRMVEIFGDEAAARQQIHSVVFNISEELKAAGAINHENPRRLNGPAGNSSWARKAHNALMLSFIKMSNIRELRASPGILEVKMMRDIKLETRVRGGRKS